LLRGKFANQQTVGLENYVLYSYHSDVEYLKKKQDSRLRGNDSVKILPEKKKFSYVKIALLIIIF
jgi:hypothetical protein